VERGNVGLGDAHGDRALGEGRHRKGESEVWIRGSVINVSALMRDYKFLDNE
jgi:hypothetical protein